jgi:Anti-sigma-K factor rskA
VQHADADQLALIALGEPLDDDAAELTAHLERCELCRQEIDALRQTVTLARETVEYRDELRPPAAVWDRITGELGLPVRASLESSPHVDASGDGWHPAEPGAPRPPGDGPMVRDSRADLGKGDEADAVGVPEPAGAGAADVRAIGAHRAPGRQWGRAVVGLVAAVALGVVGTLVAVRPWQDSGRLPVAGSVASLRPVTGGPGGVSGRAIVVQGPDGPQLDVTATGLPLERGYFEVWVFDGTVKMVAVGVLGADSTASLALPPTLDLRTYHVVDISLEQYDGDQTHSQVSVLRGTLTG